MALLPLVACSSDGDESEPTATQSPPGPSSSGSPDPGPRAYDPPVMFEADGRPVALRTSYALDGTVAYQYDNSGAVNFDGSVEAIDLLTGNQLWTVLPGAPARTLAQEARPVVADLGGQRIVVGVVPVTVQGTGTSPDREEIRVLGIDAQTGRQLFNTVLPQPPDPSGVGGALSEIAAVSDRAIIVNVSGTMFVLDPDTYQLRWQRDSFVGADIDGGVIAGLAGPDPGTRTPTGLDVADGAQRWTHDALDDARMHDAGPGLVQFSGTRLSSVPVSAIIDTVQGTERAGLDGRFECRYDDRSVTVCSDAGFLASPGRIVAFDTESVARLWELPAPGSDRLDVKVNVAFHGAVYGVTERGSVILDARTGADRVPDLQIEPIAVSEYLAITDGTTIGSDVVHLARDDH